MIREIILNDSYNSFHSPHIPKKIFDSSIPLNTSFHQSIRFYQPPPSGSINILRRRTPNYPPQFPTLRSKPLATLFLMFFSIFTLPYIYTFDFGCKITIQMCQMVAEHQENSICGLLFLGKQACQPANNASDSRSRICTNPASSSQLL